MLFCCCCSSFLTNCWLGFVMSIWLCFFMPFIYFSGYHRVCNKPQRICWIYHFNKMTARRQKRLSHQCDWRLNLNDDSPLQWSAGKTLSPSQSSCFHSFLKSCDPISLRALQLCTRCTLLTWRQDESKSVWRIEEQTANFLQLIKQKHLAINHVSRSLF